MAIIYFAIVFVTGFVLGFIRTLWLEPLLGTRMAELSEMPIMLTVIIYVSYRLFCTPGKRFTSVELLATGGLALLLLLIAEAILVVTFQRVSIPQYIADRDPVSGTVYLVALLLFAAMPWIVASSQLRRADET